MGFILGVKYEEFQIQNATAMKKFLSKFKFLWRKLKLQFSRQTASFKTLVYQERDYEYEYYCLLCN